MMKEIYFQGAKPKKEVSKEEQLEIKFHYDKPFFEKAKEIIRGRYFDEKKSPRFAFYELYETEGLWTYDYKEREDYFNLFIREMFGVDNESDLKEILSREKGEAIRTDLRKEENRTEIRLQTEDRVIPEKRLREMISEAEIMERRRKKDPNES